MRLTKGLLFSLVASLLFALSALPAHAKLDDKEWAKAERDLAQALASQNVDGIATAVELIGQDQSKRAVDQLVNIGAKLDDIKIYEAVRKALSGMIEPEAVSAMLKSLKEKSGLEQWTVRCVLVECLSPIKVEGVTAVIVKALDDKIPYVISAAAKSLGKRKDKESVQGLIGKLKELEKNKDIVWVDVKQALTDVTGWDFADAKEWEDFWKVRGASFDPEKDRGDKQESTTVVRPGEESGEFFKEKIVAKRIMFVIDISGSMEEADIPMEGKGNQKRIQVVKDELIRTVKNLKKDVKFNILAYSHVLKYWQKVQSGAALVPANDSMKADAMKWVSNLKADGATHTDEVLKKAFEPVEVNQIILLSDGAPARLNQKAGKAEPIPTGPILDMVKGLNRLRGVKINTFCFAVFQSMGGAEPLLQFMEDLAKQNGGKLTLCGGGGRPKPPEPPPQPPEPPPQPPPVRFLIPLQGTITSVF